MNKVSDKLIPKELAPFLPLAAAFIPGGGIMQQYLLPQLLQGLSSAKMTGEVDAKAQALQLGMSALKGAQKQTAAEKALLEDDELMKQLQRSDALQNSTSITDINDLKNLQGEVEGLNFMQDGGGGTGGFKERFYDYINPSQPGDTIFGFDSPFAPNEVLSFDTGDGMRYFKPGSADLNTFLESGGGGTAPDFSKLTGDALKEKLVDGTSLTDKTFDTRFGKLQDTLGKQQGLTALNKAKGFFQGPIGFNKATMTKAGLGAAPYLMNQATIMKDELEDEEEARLAQAEDFDNARSNLSTYFSRLADPTKRFGNYQYAAKGGRIGFGLGSLVSSEGVTDERMNELVQFAIDGGASMQEAFEYAKRTAAGETQMNQGGRVGLNMGGMGGMGSIPQTPMIPQGQQLDGRGGGFIPMGAQEKKDDVPAMLAKNEFVMTSDAVRAAGGGSIEKGAQKMYDMMNNLESQV